MKVVIAPDSFKDCLSAAQVATAIASGWQSVFPQADIVVCPMADGGEGTLESILQACTGEIKQTVVQGPLGQTTRANWVWLPSRKTAVIEMAQASGIQLLKPTERNACLSNSFGTGELINAALNTGATEIILTLGGSATNDAGTGMLRALGARFLDSQQHELPLGGIYLSQLSHIDLIHFDKRIKQTKFLIAADVRNPLCGEHGASYVFGPQKGASAEQVKQLDNALAHFAQISTNLLNVDKRDEAGSGAAGGMGYAAKMFFQAELQSGVEVVASLNQLAAKITTADWVITGEGKCDEQTLQGKTPFGVAKIAQSLNVPVILLAGTLGENYQALYTHGVTAAFSIINAPMTLEYACEHVEGLLHARTVDIARMIKGQC